VYEPATLGVDGPAGLVEQSGARAGGLSNGQSRVSSATAARDQWTALFPGARPGCITWDQYEANQQLLLSNAAHGTDRAAGPAREGTALLQGLAICGRCGRRRLHVRGLPGVGRLGAAKAPAPGGRLHVTEYLGTAPPLVLMHGFPDDSRIYDRLVPLLAPRRVLALDWPGYGRSGRAEPGDSHGVDHQHELRAVLNSLQLGRVALVGHDASGPDAIDCRERIWQGRSACPAQHLLRHAPALRLPEMIWLLAHTGRQFGMDPADQGGVAARSIVPQFFGNDVQPDALAAVRDWTAALFPALEQQDAHIAAGHLAALDLPVTLVFATADHYLGPDLARHLAGLFRHADVHLVDNASHWPQWNQPGRWQS
jgi:haloalkane dehalogenase